MQLIATNVSTWKLFKLLLLLMTSLEKNQGGTVQLKTKSSVKVGHVSACISQWKCAYFTEQFAYIMGKIAYFMAQY